MGLKWDIRDIKVDAHIVQVVGVSGRVGFYYKHTHSH